MNHLGNEADAANADSIPMIFAHPIKLDGVVPDDKVDALLQQTEAVSMIGIHPLTAVREVRLRLERTRSALIFARHPAQPSKEDIHFTVSHTGTHLAAMKEVIEGLNGDLDVPDKARVLQAIDIVAACAKRLNQTAWRRGRVAKLNRRAREKQVYEWLVRFIVNEFGMSATPLILAVQLSRENAREHGRGYRLAEHSWRMSHHAFRTFLRRIDKALALLDRVEARLIATEMADDNEGSERPRPEPASAAMPRKPLNKRQKKAAIYILKNQPVKQAVLMSVLEINNSSNCSQKITNPLKEFWGLVRDSDGYSFPPDAAIHALNLLEPPGELPPPTTKLG